MERPIRYWQYLESFEGSPPVYGQDASLVCNWYGYGDSAHWVPGSSPTMLTRVQVRESKRLGCNAGHQVVSRCRTKDEFEEATACRQGSMVCKQGIHPGFETQGRHHHKFQNRGMSGTTKRTDVLQILLKMLTAILLKSWMLWYLDMRICFSRAALLISSLSWSASFSAVLNVARQLAVSSSTW